MSRHPSIKVDGPHANSSGPSRRDVLKSVGAAGVGVAVGTTAFAGVASAHTVTRIAFCGCSQVVVYGSELDDGQYTAILYCGDPPGGTIECAPLTGTAERVNYEITGGDCKIIGLVGTTNPDDGNEQTFSVCNDIGPQQCSAKALSTIEHDDLLHCLVSAASGSENKLTITETYDGGRAEYELTVSGALEEYPDTSSGDGLEGDDTIDGTTATGVVTTGADTFRYEGDITDFSFETGSTRVLVNDQQVNLLCGTPLADLGIEVRSGGCGPADPGPPDRGPQNQQGPKSAENEEGETTRSEENAAGKKPDEKDTEGKDRGAGASTGKKRGAKQSAGKKRGPK